MVAGQEFVTVSPQTPVEEAARLMAARQIGAVPIAEDGRIVGIFTERDALTRIVATGRNPASTPIGDVMSTTLIVANVNESCEACLERMRQAHIRHLIVLDNDRMAGVLSMRDLMTVDLDDKLETITLLTAYAQSAPLDAWNRAT
jgi:CBS domain-containing protein